MTSTKRVLHWVIIGVLGTGFLAALYMVFVVYRVPDAGVGPMMSRSSEVPFEFFMRRRMYAIDAWLTFGFLSVYLALTSLRPAAPGDAG